MIPPAFTYDRPSSLPEALAMLAAGGDVKILAGGHSLLPLMKIRLASPGRLVDIGRLDELKGVRRLDDGRIVVGALTTYRELMESAASEFGLIRDAVPQIGDVQVRNRGTIGGAIAHADPASDMTAIALALDADLVLASTGGTRTVPADRFSHGAFETSCGPDEILTEIILPAPRDDAGSAYRALEQPASGYPIVGVGAVVVGGGADGPITLARIGITGVGEVAYRAREVEDALVGSDGSDAAIAAAAEHAVDGVTVRSDIHADAEYRAAMARVYTRRAIAAALGR
jgi:carbon-monoxide dehydrogenase medium subunit